MDIKTADGNHDVASQGLGNAGLALGIVGTSLALLNNGGLGGLGGLFGNNAAAMAAAGTAQAVLSEKDSIIAKLSAEKYADRNGIEVYKQVKVEQNDLRDRLLGNWIKPLADEAAANRVNIARIEEQMKASKETAELKEKLTNARINEVAMVANHGISCLQGQVAGLYKTVGDITKVVIPKSAICPPVMSRYNTWVAPTTPEPDTEAEAGA